MNKRSVSMYYFAVALIVASLSFMSKSVKPVAAFDVQEGTKRDDMMAIADAYYRFQWVAQSQNIKHGSHVDTPDRDWCLTNLPATWGCWYTPAVNFGVPYFWGGSTAIEDKPNDGIPDLYLKPHDLFYPAGGVPPVGYFGQKLVAGAPAGDVITTDDPAWSYANGVDCIGFIGQVWRTGTRLNMPKALTMMRPIRFQDLRAGDVVQRYISGSTINHVILFKNWVNYTPGSGTPPIGTRFQVYEAALKPNKVVISTYELTAFGAGSPVVKYFRNKGYLTDKVQIKRIESCDPNGCTPDNSYQDPDYYPYTYLTPIDVVLVIDRSGSMAGSKLAQAKSSAKMFVDLMRPGDKISIVSFASNTTINYPLTEILAPGSLNYVNVKGQAKAAIDALIASGGTAMGSGMLKGQEALNVNGTSDPNRNMVLLTDGVEGSTPYARDVLGGLIADKITIHTVGLGSDADHVTLGDIAYQSGGEYHFFFANGMSDIFNSIYAKVYGENVVSQTAGTVAQNATVEQSVMVDSSIGSITFSLNWPGSDLDLTLVKPDGTVVNPSVADTDPDIAYTTGSTYEFYTVYAPQEGTWKMRIFGKSTSSPSESYIASASAIDAMMVSAVSDGVNHVVGDPIRITTSVDDSSVTDPLGTDHVRGVIMQVTVQDPLMNSHSMSVYDDGLHGDGAANDGVYSNVFTNTSLAGSYKFNISASGINNIYQQPFTREFDLTVVVKSATLACTPSNAYYGSNQASFKFASYKPDADKDNFAHLPLSFIENVGQEDPSVKYHAQGLGGKLFFTDSEVVLTLPNPVKVDGDDKHQTRYDLRPASVVRINYQGANPKPEIVSVGELPGVVNVLKGNDPEQWRTNLPTYPGVSYQDIYPGINLNYEGTNGELKSTFTIAPGADPSAIAWKYKGVDRVEVDATGNLVIRVTKTAEDNAVLVESAPLAWQDIDGNRIPVDVRYAVDRNGKVGFVLGAYDSTLELVIDPTLVFSTYLGGGKSDEGDAITVDSSCNIYVSGETASTNFPTVNGFQPNLPQTDVFVSKMNPAGTTVLYSTYLGGDQDDHGWGVALDSQGRITLAGETESTNFPLLNAFSTTPGGGTCAGVLCDDVFVTQLNAAGNALRYSSYFSTGNEEEATGMALGPGDMIYVTGITKSSAFPVTANAYDTVFGGGTCSNAPCEDGFLLKVDPALSGTASLKYSSFFGGSKNDRGMGIAVDTGGMVYITGYTESSDFPVRNAYQSTRAGSYDAILIKFDTALSGNASMVYSTFVGGSSYDRGTAIALGGPNQVYLTGYTYSTNFPRANAFQNAFGGGTCGANPCYDAYVTHLNIANNTLVYGSYLGGSGEEKGLSIAVDNYGSAYITGYTRSTNFPTVSPFQATKGANGCSTPPCADAFVTRVNAGGNALLYSTYLGGSQEDFGYGVVLDGLGNAYVVGFTFSSNFPTTPGTSPFVGASSYSDVFIIKIRD